MRWRTTRAVSALTCQMEVRISSTSALLTSETDRLPDAGACVAFEARQPAPRPAWATLGALRLFAGRAERRRQKVGMPRRVVLLVAGDDLVVVAVQEPLRLSVMLIGVPRGSSASAATIGSVEHGTSAAHRACTASSSLRGLSLRHLKVAGIRRRVRRSAIAGGRPVGMSTTTACRSPRSKKVLRAAPPARLPPDVSDETESVPAVDAAGVEQIADEAAHVAGQLADDAVEFPHLGRGRAPPHARLQVQQLRHVVRPAPDTGGRPARPSGATATRPSTGRAFSGPRPAGARQLRWPSARALHPARHMPTVSEPPPRSAPTLDAPP